MATKITDLTPLGTTPTNTDVLHIVDVSDTSGGAAGTSKKIQVSNLLASAGAVDSVNGQTGVVVLDVNDLDDVISLSPTQGDVLQWNSGISKWIESSQLTTLWAEFRNGTSVNVYANSADTTTGRLELTLTGANVKTGVTGMTVTETSPGDIEFTVATGSTGQTTHSAVLIDGTTTGSQTDFLLKAGTKLKISDGTYYTWLKASGNAADTTLTLPVGNGTLALTSDLPSVPVDSVNGQTGVVVLDTDDINEGTTNLYYTDARVDANSDVVANTAKVGITSGQASAITANTAKVSNVQSDWNASSGLAVILNKPTLTSGTVTSVAMSVPSAFAISGSPITTSGTLALSVGGSAAQYIDGTGALQTLPQGVTSVSGTAPIVVTGSNTPTVSITAATTSAAGSMSSADKTKLDNITTSYEEDELKTGQNILMNTSIGVASNKIVDIMGDALADTSNANSKKLIGYHTGSGVCVLQGMVDAVSAINGATAGGPLWIGASGVFSSAAPTTANYYSRVVGYFVGTGQGGEVICYFNPSQDWIEIS